MITNEFENNKINIKIIFKIIGAADAAANLLCEFKIAEKKEAKHTKNKNGKVIRVKLIANSIFASSFINPGAMIDTNTGMKISTIITKKNKLKNKRLKILLANISDCFFPLTISEAVTRDKGSVKSSLRK